MRVKAKKKRERSRRRKCERQRERRVGKGAERRGSKVREMNTKVEVSEDEKGRRS